MLGVGFLSRGEILKSIRVAVFLVLLLVVGTTAYTVPPSGTLVHEGQGASAGLYWGTGFDLRGENVDLTGTTYTWTAAGSGVIGLLEQQVDWLNFTLTNAGGAFTTVYWLDSTLDEAIFVGQHQTANDVLINVEFLGQSIGNQGKTGGTYEFQINFTWDGNFLESARLYNQGTLVVDTTVSGGTSQPRDVGGFGQGGGAAGTMTFSADGPAIPAITGLSGEITQAADAPTPALIALTFPTLPDDTGGDYDYYIVYQNEHLDTVNASTIVPGLVEYTFEPGTTQENGDVFISAYNVETGFQVTGPSCVITLDTTEEGDADACGSVSVGGGGDGGGDPPTEGPIAAIMEALGDLFGIGAAAAGYLIGVLIVLAVLISVTVATGSAIVGVIAGMVLSGGLWKAGLFPTALLFFMGVGLVIAAGFAINRGAD